TGNYIDVGIEGHTDEFVRFSGPNTILLAWVDENEKDLNPVNRMNYDRLNENFNILQMATDQDGRTFTIVKVPLPDVVPLKVKK
ncbi:MAG: agmatine deiminase family protein, partial [Bacteroidetes bacterium]|nr:agmatine deiminase family protein [Bacteroidota bacterium]